MLVSTWPHPVPPIGAGERLDRLSALRSSMEAAGVGAVVLGSSDSLRYFTGLVWHSSERLCGAVVRRDDLTYVVPGFERSRVDSLPKLDGEIAIWEEDEDYASLVAALAGQRGSVALDDALPLFVYFRLAGRIAPDRLVDGALLLRNQRMRKSPAEIALIQYAMDLTLDVHKRVHDRMKPGVRASDVVRYIDDEHRRMTGAGSTFCIVSFGTATALPHGAPYDQVLEPGEIIQVDTGARVDGYNSDITRTYFIDEPDKEAARLWRVEHEAQKAVFDAARIGATCSSLDAAARSVIEAAGMGPDYRLPGLPHRAGHGVGLEGHEEPYIVRGNETPLEEGMCFSNEPMIVIPDKYGIRLEDHIYMAADGPRWFTQPSKSPTEPFG